VEPEREIYAALSTQAVQIKFHAPREVRMKRLTVSIVSVTLLLVACAPSIVMPTASAPTATPLRPAVLRIELPTEPDISDLPRVMAADTLREMGYTIEPLDFQDNALAIQALVQGNSDFGFVGAGVAWPAIQKGAPLVSILDGTLDSGMVVVGAEIQECADLNGKRIGVPSLNSNRALLLRKYVAETCPEVEFEPVIISNQTNQLIALETEQIDAATVQNGTFRKFQAGRDADLHVLVSYADVFPGLGGAQWQTRRAFLEEYPETVKDLIRADLLARRKLQDAQVFAEALVKYLKMEPTEAKEIGELFYDQKLWDPDGGMTPERVSANLDFIVEAGILEPGLKPEEVAATEPLNAVLEEIGRVE
jgi:ABC-type nitrate/sulfonate/bicarbonate transport system substrate-binding protein